jgi:hypothetical protein
MPSNGFSKLIIIIISAVVLISTVILVWQYWQTGKTTIPPSVISPPKQEEGKEGEFSEIPSIPEEAAGPKTEKANGRPPLEVLKNMEYQLFECPTSSSIDNDDAEEKFNHLYLKAICRVKLDNGRYSFCEKNLQMCLDFWGSYVEEYDVDFSEAKFVDLNNDNMSDALVELRVFYGGNASELYLASVIIKGNEYHNRDTIAIPCHDVNSCSIYSFSVDNGIITLYTQGKYEESCHILRLRFSEDEGFKVIEKKYLDYPCDFSRDLPSPRDRF